MGVRTLKHAGMHLEFRPRLTILTQTPMAVVHMISIQKSPSVVTRMISIQKIAVLELKFTISIPKKALEVAATISIQVCPQVPLRPCRCVVNAMRQPTMRYQVRFASRIYASLLLSFASACYSSQLSGKAYMQILRVGMLRSFSQLERHTSCGYAVLGFCAEGHVNRPF